MLYLEQKEELEEVRKQLMELQNKEHMNEFGDHLSEDLDSDSEDSIDFRLNENEENEKEVEDKKENNEEI